MQQADPVEEILTLANEATAVDSGERVRPAPWHHLTRLTGRAETMVGAGAVIGVFARFIIGNLAHDHLTASFPLGTLLINLLGCLLIGVVQTLFLDLAAVRRDVQLFTAVGFCGGFTTFSTFSLETLQLLQEGRVPMALLYQALSLVGGVLAVVAGMGIAHGGVRGKRRRTSRR